MYNPARLLHQTFTEWARRLQNAGVMLEARKPADGLGEFDVEGHVTAMEHLVAVGRLLDTLTSQGLPVEPYKKYMARWTQMLVNYPSSWTAGIQGEGVFTTSDLDHLQTLAVLADVRMPRLNPRGGEILAETLPDIQDLLEETPSLSDELRLYIANLSREIQAALDDEVLGGAFDFAAACERLWVALHAAAGQSDTPESKAKWQSIASRIFTSATGAALGSLPAIFAGALGM